MLFCRGLESLFLQRTYVFVRQSWTHMNRMLHTGVGGSASVTIEVTAVWNKVFLNLKSCYFQGYKLGLWCSALRNSDVKRFSYTLQKQILKARNTPDK